MSYERQIGSRAQVMNGTCHHTPGGLTKKDLKYNKHGRIVSRKKSLKAKKDNRLVKAGYVAKKGTFKLFKKGDNKKSRKMRGGASSLSPSPYDGKGVGTSGVYLQTNVAGTH
jgi:3-deoxy-D-arabino-heptulosonate 7-phosphate (DAHP) synthase